MYAWYHSRYTVFVSGIHDTRCLCLVSMIAMLMSGILDTIDTQYLWRESMIDDTYA